MFGPSRATNVPLWPAAATDWQILYAGVFDAPSGGNMLLYWSIPAGAFVPAGGVLRHQLGLDHGVVLYDAPKTLAQGGCCFTAGAKVGFIHTWGAPVYAGTSDTLSL